MENKELCELVSPFNIEQPRDAVVQQPHAQSKSQTDIMQEL
jgi:hypothetical protein